MSELDTPSRDLTLLAPNFRLAVEAAVAACRNAGHPVKINEAYRSQARQAWLYAQGRTRPGDVVTNAPTSLTSWHGYGLAVDVIHETKAYWPFGREKEDRAQNEKWFKEVAAIFKAQGLNWGGDWQKPDTPHMQWGRCTASPTQGARTLFAAEGVRAVWQSLSAG